MRGTGDSTKAAAPPAGRAPPDPGAAVLVLGGRRVYPRAGGTQRDYRLLAAAVVSGASRRAHSLLHASDSDLRLPLTGCFVGIHDYNWMSSVVHVSGQRVTTLGPAVSFCDVIAERPVPRLPGLPLSPRGPLPWPPPVDAAVPGPVAAGLGKGGLSGSRPGSDRHVLRLWSLGRRSTQSRRARVSGADVGVWGSGEGVAACAEPVPALSGAKEAGGRLLVRARSPRRRDPLPGPARGGQPERGRRAPACLLRPDPGSATTPRSCWGRGGVHSGWTCLMTPRNTRYRTGLLSGDSGHLPSSREARAQRGARCRLRHREESERGLRAPSDPPGKPHSAAPQRRDLEHGPPPPQLGDGVHGGSCGRKRDGL